MHRQMLTEAAQQGVKRAAAYLNLVVDDTFQRHLQMVGLSLLASVILSETSTSHRSSAVLTLVHVSQAPNTRNVTVAD